MSETPQTFGPRANSYDEYAVVQRDAAAWLAEWLPEKGEFATCLEFGAGTGLFTEFLLDRFEMVEATDTEPSMVERCRTRHPWAKHNTRNAWEPQHDGIRWDFITAASLMQWAKDPVECLSNWRGIMSPGGHVLLGFFAAPSLPEVLDVLPDGGPVSWRSPDDWADAVDSAGLKLVKIESDTRRYNYPTALDLWKSLHHTGAIVSKKMTPSRMMQMFRDYESRFSDQKGVFATWTVCRLLAAV